MRRFLHLVSGPPLSADTAWQKVLKDDPGASAQTFEDWYRLWNFRDEDIAKIMDGVYKLSQPPMPVVSLTGDV